jgi:hypothetical protein
MIPTRDAAGLWHDTFITELRLREIPGDRIGEALAEIDTHCADSGQTPAEAFGDPIVYAASVIAASAPVRKGAWERVGRPMAQVFATLAGVFCFINGIDAATHGGQGVLTAGQLLAVALGTVTFPAVIAAVFHPAVFRRRWLWAGVVIAAPTAIGIPVVLWRTPVVHISGWMLLTVGLFLLAAAWWPVASDRIVADRIVDPRTGTEPFVMPRLVGVAIRWWLPAVLLFTVVVTALLP